MNLFKHDYLDLEVKSEKPSFIKRKNNYRLAESKLVSCENCKSIKKYNLNNKTYYKCIHIGLSSSDSTDIRLKYVCDLYEG